MHTTIFNEEQFQTRHIGPNEPEQKEMLDFIGVGSLDELIDQTIPASIRLKSPLALPEAMSEHCFLNKLTEAAQRNKLFTSYIGMGYYNTITPPVILRNVLENPGWYTQYTPYQPEIAQGRLEALINYQTMVMDLTGMEVANASLLDEATAAAEGMAMLHGIVTRNAGKESANKFFVSDTVLPQTTDVLRTRAGALGFELVFGSYANHRLDETYFGALLQYPAQDGAVRDYRDFIRMAHDAGALVVVAADLLSLALLTPPGEFGADVVVGSSQRFGVPLGYGGPHAAFMATKNDYIRNMPGRIIGVSIDANGNNAYRMTLQTREQHIRREKATSNICTAQALLAIIAGMYGAYHGPDGLRRIARNIHGLTVALEKQLIKLGYEQTNALYFDTLKVKVGSAERIRAIAETAEVNFRYVDENTICISLDETTSPEDVRKIIAIFAEAAEIKNSSNGSDSLFTGVDVTYSDFFARKSNFMTHPVFNSYHSETEMLRYLKSLENKDLSLVHSMIPLGSCTMKLNATAELVPITWKEFGALHPFVPINQAEGYQHIFKTLEAQLCAITGFAAASLQPNSGAQGEYAGLMVIRAYHWDKNEEHRDVALIPQSAHGTNPASAVMAGMKVVVVKTDKQGNILLDDLRAKAEEHKKDLAALMVTYPSTHGVFEEAIREVCSVIHQHGGLVYMDGANLNAQVGLTSPAMIGADVCHINLHKTFSIPHGGGGPGMGPICVTRQLAGYLPGHAVIKVGGEKAIPAISAAPWGSSSILLISYAYITLLGREGVTNSTKVAILNANYLKAKLEKDYPVLYQGANGRVAHEFILDTRGFKSAGVEVEDIGKRLMDYGFHAPTVSFPVAGTLMIEPTESESKAELDRFAEAMISIRHEIQEIIDGKADATDNVLKNAPHTAAEALSETWNHKYTRYKAVYPLSYLRKNKFWPAVGRVNNSYGDRNIMCACPPIEEYQAEMEKSST